MGQKIGNRFNTHIKYGLLALASAMATPAFSDTTHIEQEDAGSAYTSLNTQKVDLSRYDAYGSGSFADGLIKVGSNSNQGINRSKTVVKLPEKPNKEESTEVDTQEKTFFDRVKERSGLYFGTSAGADGSEFFVGVTNKPVDLPWGLSVGINTSVTHTGNTAFGVHLNETQDLWTGATLTAGLGYHYDTILEGFGVDAEYQTVRLEFNQSVYESLGIGVVGSHTRYFNLRADDQYVDDTFYGVSMKVGQFANMQIGAQTLKIEDGTVAEKNKFQLRYGFTFG